MMQYRRTDIEGASYFFTINLMDRKSSLLVDEIDKLREVINKVKHKHPFKLDAMVIMPEHLHLIMTLPDGDNNYSKRIMLIKSGFSRQIPKTELIKKSRKQKRERGIWQRRYWEHLIRNKLDFQRHVDYIHYNPVKHEHVESPIDWQYLTIQKYVEKGIYDKNWGNNHQITDKHGFGE